MWSAIGLPAALLLIAPCVLGQPPAAKSELQKAVEEFKIQTRSLGLRRSWGTGSTRPTSVFD